MAPQFARIKEVIPLLNRLSDPKESPQLEDYTYFLRLHARAYKETVYSQLLADHRFLAIKSKVDSQVSSLSAQSVCDVLYWARSGNITGSCSLLEVIPKPEAIAARITQLCAEGAFHIRQIVPLFNDCSVLQLQCVSLIQSQVLLLLRDSNEVFSTEALKQLLRVIEKMDPIFFDWEVLELTLQRWLKEPLWDQNINILSDGLADMLRLETLHRSELLDQTVKKFVVGIIPRVDELSDFNLKLLLPALIRSDLPMDLVSALVRELEVRNKVVEMHYRACLGLFYLSQRPQVQCVCSPALMQQIYTRLSDSIDSINADSFETLLKSMGKLKHSLPLFLVEKLKEKALKSRNFVWILSYAMLDPDSATFLSTHRALLESAVNNATNADLVSALSIIKAMDKIPEELIRIKNYFQVNMISYIRKRTSSMLQLCNLNELAYPSTKTTFKFFHKMLFSVIQEYFPVYHKGKAIRFLFNRFADYPVECTNVIRTNITKLETADLQMLLRTTNKSIRLEYVTDFLSAFTGLLTPSLLMSTLKFEFEVIPERFNDLLETVPGPFLSTPEFSQHYTRLLNKKSLTSKFWERLAKETEAMQDLAEDTKLRVIAELLSKGLLDETAAAQAIKTANNLESSAMVRIRAMTKEVKTDFQPAPATEFALSSIQEIADILTAVLQEKHLAPDQATALLSQVKKGLCLLPLPHALNIFDHYSVYDSPDQVTSELLNCLWEKIKTRNCYLSAASIIRFLTPASIIQWGGEKDLTEMIWTVTNSYGQLSTQDKVLFTRVLGQFAITTPGVWNQLVRDLTRTTELITRYGSDLIYSLHQARINTILVPENVMGEYRRVIYQGNLLSPEDFCKGLIALLRRDNTIKVPENFEKLVAIQQSLPERFPEFKTYLLHMFIQHKYRWRHPPVPSPESLPRYFLSHPICSRFPPLVQSAFSNLSIDYENGAIRDGLLFPHYFPSSKTGIWVSNRVHSKVTQNLLGDFSLYWKIAMKAGHTLIFIPETYLLNLKDPESWCRQVLQDVIRVRGSSNRTLV